MLNCFGKKKERERVEIPNDMTDLSGKSQITKMSNSFYTIAEHLLSNPALYNCKALQTNVVSLSLGTEGILSSKMNQKKVKTLIKHYLANPKVHRICHLI